MNRNRSYLFAAPLLLACTAAPVSAQQQDLQLWTSTVAAVPLSDDWELSGGLLVRASELREGIYQLQFVGDVQHEVGDGVSIGAGYSYIPNYRAGERTRTENRIRQQVAFPVASVGGGRIAARVRLEQRWRDDGDDIKLRLRPALTYSLPIGEGTSLRLGHESFLNLNATDWGPATGYDRVRHQVSVRHDLGGGLTGEAGYLNQYVFVGDDPEEMDHVLTLGVGYSF